MRKSYITHLDSLDILDEMTNEQAGIFIKAIKQYHLTGELPALDFALKIAVTPFINQYIRDAENYQITCERRRIAGAKGGKQKVANASNSKQDLANLADNDSKSDNDSDSKKDSKSVSVKDNNNDAYIPLAEGLLFVLEAKLNKSFPKTVIKAWSAEIRKLVEIDLKIRTDAYADVKKVIQAISDNWGADYFPIVQAGSSLREKFTKVENFLERSQKPTVNKAEQNSINNSKTIWETDLC